MVTVERYHDISCGHRVVGHESKCKFLHGHNYRFYFTITGKMDNVGRVIDFGEIKRILCEWLEEVFDHKMLIWKDDPMLESLLELSRESICIVSFNPTAENIAKHMVETVAPNLLKNTRLIKCRVEETRKCSATYEISNK